MKRIPDIKIHPLFKSKIYLISETTDPLAQKDKIVIDDLAGRTLMVGGGSQPELRAVQQRVLQNCIWIISTVTITTPPSPM